MMCEPDIWCDSNLVRPKQEPLDSLGDDPGTYMLQGLVVVGEEEGRSSLLNYVINTDGSVVCKLCGEVLPSRTHWYRHKYRTHDIRYYRCDWCTAVFRSKKGYEGHLESRHSSVNNSSRGSRSASNAASGRGAGTEGNTNREDRRRDEKSEAELVEAIIRRVREECEAQGGDINRRGYVKH